MNDIRREVIIACNLFEITHDELISSSRIMERTYARQLLAHYYMTCEKMHPGQVAKIINRDRITVLHSCKVVDQLYLCDDYFADKFNKFYDRLI